MTLDERIHEMRLVHAILLARRQQAERFARYKRNQKIIDEIKYRNHIGPPKNGLDTAAE